MASANYLHVRRDLTGLELAARFLEQFLEQIGEAEIGGHRPQVQPVDAVILHLEHSKSIHPLAIGNVAAFAIPLELVEDDVFGRGDEHLGSSFIDLDTSPPFDLALEPGVSTRG